MSGYPRKPPAPELIQVRRPACFCGCGSLDGCGPTGRGPDGVGRGGQRRGFTLIELVMLVAIVGLMTAVAMPRYGRAVAGFRLDAAARRVASDLARARAQAVTSSKAQVVTFDAAGGCYVLESYADTDHPTNKYWVYMTADPYKARIVSATFGAGSVVTFDMFGTPSSAGSVVIQTGGRQKSIVLDVTSGKATIQ